MRAHWRLARTLILATVVAGCGADPAALVPDRGPDDVVRLAFDRLAAHDLLGGSTLVCPAMRDPSRPAVSTSLFAPVGGVPMPEFAETYAMLDIDISGVRVADVDAREGVVQVPVEGVMRLSFDPAEVETAVRTTAAAQDEAVDETELRRTLEAIAAGPYELDLAQDMVPVQVMKFGDTWFICENPPSPAPLAP